MKSLIALTCLLLTPLIAAVKPNVIVIIADDCTYSDLAIHGGQNAKTPNIDSLAKQGTIFDRAYLGMAMCAPSRSELYTGRLPLRNGCAWNQGTSRPGTKSMPHLLGDLGYRVGLAGKSHVQPASVYPFENVPGYDENCVNNPTRPNDTAGVKNFITRDDAQPFCLVVALTEPHAPWVMGDASAYPPKSLKLPANFADTPMTRQSFSRYLAEVTYMDNQVGELLALLETTKKASDTLVLFTSEQGAQFPGNKWTNWDTGLHTSLVARWPGVVPAGRRTPALVQYADVLPTLMDLAGGKPDASAFDGASFAPVLRGEGDRHREFVYGMHNNYPEGPPYPIRSISNGDWRYIRNLSPEKLYIEKHMMGRDEHNPYWSTWMFRSTEDAHALHMVQRYMHRPAEELYHTAEDRFEMTNLATDPAHAETKARLAAALDRSLTDQLDPGVPLDTPSAFEASQKQKPVFPGKP
ncbi:sulfatase [Luteolibacter yonseiensis]|uniref:Sulfatase n=1 Tax=Luteolibacter yonseiensis TaxID=1144680 RepID=A0A934VA62_9BACT|nr:sulfatase [Luteolibacter yonseiensis]MBK1814820.1 sulfatase [Luteolibacter yonseiensis]